MEQEFHPADDLENWKHYHRATINPSGVSLCFYSPFSPTIFLSCDKKREELREHGQKRFQRALEKTLFLQ